MPCMFMPLPACKGVKYSSDSFCAEQKVNIEKKFYPPYYNENETTLHPLQSHLLPLLFASIP